MKKEYQEKKKESSALRFLYHTLPGRLLLKPLTSRAFSKAAGTFMDSRFSKPLIGRFVKKNGIHLEDFHADAFTCFNDCFTRKIKDGKRPLDPDPQALIAPCDALLSAYRITEDIRLSVKNSVYSVEDLLGNKELAAGYTDGICLVFRLCVHHYHRYIYLDNGHKENNVFIKGKLHTVRPIALETYPVFARNCREYTVMHTEHFGDVTQIEVGALLVGKIQNHHQSGEIKRGNEKGTFLYGGSTVILLLQKDQVALDSRFFEATEKDLETEVEMGERLGFKPLKEE